MQSFIESYYDIGHNTQAELWIYIKGKVIIRKPKKQSENNHDYIFTEDEMDKASFYGRIDHSKKTISMTDNDMAAYKLGPQVKEHVAKTIQKVKRLTAYKILYFAYVNAAPDGETMLIDESASLSESPMKGELKINNRGFIYLDISDDFIKSAFKMVSDKNKQLPPYFGDLDDIGGHISVIFKDELDIETTEVKELGSQFEFYMKKMVSTNPNGWDDMKKVYFIVCESKELEKLRSRYGLPKKRKGFDFHITIAVVTKN